MCFDMCWCFLSFLRYKLRPVPFFLFVLKVTRRISDSVCLKFKTALFLRSWSLPDSSLLFFSSSLVFFPPISLFPSVVCCGELLKAVAADESSMGELIKPFLESGRRGKLLHLLTHTRCQTGHAPRRSDAESECGLVWSLPTLLDFSAFRQIIRPPTWCTVRPITSWCLHMCNGMAKNKHAILFCWPGIMQ